MTNSIFSRLVAVAFSAVLFFGMSVPVNAQASFTNGSSPTEIVAQSQPAHQSVGGVTFYTDRPTYEGDFPGQAVEDFEEYLGGGVGTCGLVINDASSDDCFMPGDIIAGVDYTSDGTSGGGMVALDETILATPSNVVGPNFFAEVYWINMTDPATAVGFDLTCNCTDSLDVEVYNGASGTGALLGSTTVPVSLGAYSFVGMDSPSAIGSIVVRSNSGGGELIDNFSFGVPAPGGLEVSCSATPSGGGPVIPAEGGELFYDFSATNNDTVPRTFDIWFNISGPDERERGPFQPRMLDPGESLNVDIGRNVPAGAAAGVYTYTCNIGEAYPTAESSSGFDFEKLPEELATRSPVVLAWDTDAEIDVQIPVSQDTVVPAPQASVVVGEVDVPGTHVMNAAYPNPFNPEATFQFAVSADQFVQAELVDMLGRVVTSLFSGTVTSGQLQTVRIDGSNLPSGMYLIRIAGENFSEVSQVTLLK